MAKKAAAAKKTAATKKTIVENVKAPEAAAPEKTSGKKESDELAWMRKQNIDVIAHPQSATVKLLQMFVEAEDGLGTPFDDVDMDKTELAELGEVLQEARKVVIGTAPKKKEFKNEK